MAKISLLPRFFLERQHHRVDRPDYDVFLALNDVSISLPQLCHFTSFRQGRPIYTLVFCPSSGILFYFGVALLASPLYLKPFFDPVISAPSIIFRLISIDLPEALE